MQQKTHRPVRISDDMQQAVLAAQVDSLYRQLPRVLGYTVLVMVLITYMLKDAVPHIQIGIWLAAMLAILLARALLYTRYRRVAGSTLSAPWAHRFVLFAGLSGIAWGMAGVMLFAPERLELQALVLLVLAGMGAGSAAVLPMYLPSFYAYFPVSMLPVGVMMFLQGSSFHVIMGFFDVIFTVGLLTFGRAVGESFRTSLELRFENIELVRALQAQKTELERANLAKSKFLAAASHDLRQPMHALTLFSEVLEQHAGDARTQSLAGSIRTSVGALARLFDALLDISRLDAGVLTPHITVFPVQGLLDRVVNDCRPYAREKNLTLDCPPCGFYTASDPTLLERILRNLVTNAIRYTESGSVILQCERAGDTLQLVVADTGVGIAADEHENIFEEFTQLGNPERDREKGLGLGLSIVRRLSRLLNHPLTLESRPGEGTRFSLQLPWRDAPSSRSAIDRQAEVYNPARLDIQVMVVDDDPEVRAGMRALLESWGCGVITAAGSEEAQQAMAEEHAALDAVIADFRLPDGQKGTRLIESLRAQYGAGIPALLVTGDTEPARLQEARDGGIELLHKPVAPARLRAWLRKTTRH